MLCRMNYCNELQGSINYVISNSRNTSRGCIKCPCKKYRNKMFINPDVFTMNIQKNSMKEYLFWYAHGKEFVSQEIMVKRMVESNCSSTNMHGVRYH